MWVGSEKTFLLFQLDPYRAGIEASNEELNVVCQESEDVIWKGSS